MILHAREDDVEHLRERCLGGGLVDEVLAGQVDVVTRAHGLQHGAFVDLYVLGGHRRQQGLEEREQRVTQGRTETVRRTATTEGYMKIYTYMNTWFTLYKLLRFLHEKDALISESLPSHTSNTQDRTSS